MVALVLPIYSKIQSLSEMHTSPEKNARAISNGLVDLTLMSFHEEV